MKREFLTLALLATVAVGGAFASNSARVQEYGINASNECIAGELDPGCNRASGPQCTVTFPDLTTGPAYDFGPTECTQPLTRSL